MYWYIRYLLKIILIEVRCNEYNIINYNVYIIYKYKLKYIKSVFYKLKNILADPFQSNRNTNFFRRSSKM